jgi:hypothetical protein
MTRESKLKQPKPPKAPKIDPLEECRKKISIAMEKADAAAKAMPDPNPHFGDQRLGSLTPENAEFVRLLIEEMYIMLGAARRDVGALNEVFIYLARASNEIVSLRAKLQKLRAQSLSQGDA